MKIIAVNSSPRKGKFKCDLQNAHDSGTRLVQKIEEVQK